ncbi:MAG: glycosyltransferase family 4 protein [Gammaproteobacteria bacterium]|nr:glycosyltransferase family 4 protein [Gammaproteobacteria bacterium]
MRTGIFVTFVGGQHAGPEVYERNLVNAIARVDQDNEYDVFCLGHHAAKEFNISQENVRIHAVVPGNRWLGVPFGLPIALLRQSVDFYHATSVPAPVSPASYVFTQHDVSPFVHPEFYPGALGARLRRLIRVGLKRARYTICISEHARESTAELFGIPKERMAVVHHGVDPRFQPLDRKESREFIKSKYSIDGPFVLYVGKLESRKNIVRLIDAFAAFSRDNGDGWKLVLTGRRFWGMDGIDAAVKRNELTDSIIEIGYIPAEDLPSLYCAAKIFAFPTLWEGFGLPVLEAMACGTPTITSNISCLPEIAGDGAVLVDPYRVDDIAGAMCDLARNQPDVDAMVERGLKRAGEFTWESTARKTIAAYETGRSA